MTAEPEPMAPASEDTLRHLEAIHRLTAATVAASTVELIYEAALDVLVCSLSADRAAILLYDPDGVIRFKAWRGLSDRYRDAAEGHSPWARDEPAPEVVVIPDVAADQHLGDLRDTILGEGIRSLAFVPLLYGRRLLGKFMLYSDDRQDFRADELALATTVAGHIAFALEKRRLEDELRLGADQLAATLNAVGEGITVQAVDGSLVFANDAAAAMVGFSSAAEMLGAERGEIAARYELFDEEGGTLAPDRLPGRAALRGEEPPEILVRWRRASTGTEHCSLVRARPVRDETGQVRFAVNVFRDVTERQVALDALRASEARLAFLAAASRRLMATSLEPRRVLAQVADLVVPELADWCVVREFSDEGGVERVAIGPSTFERGELVARLEAYGDPLQGHPALQELQSGRSLLFGEVAPSMLEELARDAEHLELLRQLGLRSLMLVPLRTRGRTIGVLSLAGGSRRPPYGDADLALAEEFAARVAATVDNARSFAIEHATAETLARALLPGRLPEIPGVALAARYRAAGDVGGDFYDCFPLGEGTWMLVVGDVCGRGIQAASMTGLTRHTVRAAALHASSPAAVLSDLNRVLLDAAGEGMGAWLSKERGVEPSFCTVCVATVTPTTEGARVVVSSAGHPLPFVLGRSGSLAEVGRPGSLLGVVTDFRVSEESCDLGAGDALVLFTDGITERRRAGHLFEEDLPAVLREAAGSSADGLAQRVEDAALSFATTTPDDDMAVLVLAVPAVSGALALPRPAVPETVGL